MSCILVTASNKQVVVLCPTQTQAHPQQMICVLIVLVNYTGYIILVQINVNVNQDISKEVFLLLVALLKYVPIYVEMVYLNI